MSAISIDQEPNYRLALRYALFGSEPTVLVVMGRAASGKGTLLSALGCELGFEVFSSDRMPSPWTGIAS
jgi:hypothetical protein